MTENFDISNLDLQEALKLQEAVREQIKNSTETQKDQIRAAVQALSEVTGRPVQGLLADLFPVAPLPPKYIDPTNPKNTWSGKGKKPGWLVTAVEAGATLESLAV
jgi:DNA-binding protein H-NS